MKTKLPSVASKPYLYFWAAATIILLTGVVYEIKDPEAVVDINVHDTYFVIGSFYITILLTFLYFFAGLIYWGLRSLRLIKVLTCWHTIISVGSVFIYWPVVQLLGFTESPYSDNANTGSLIIMLAVLLIQPLFILNILITPLKGKLNKQRTL